ncbi:MAG: hypothetical protein ABI459_05205 [Deltaproteobacteria bacterium]
MNNLDRLKKRASWLRVATLCVVVALPVLIGAALTLNMPMTALPQPVSPDVTRGQVMSAQALGLVSVAALIWTLLRMRQLFGAYAAGDVLSEANALTIQRIGQGMLAVAALGVVVRPVQSLILTLENASGQRAIAVSLSSADIGFLLAGGLLSVIGWAMHEAAQAADENRSFV